MLSSKQFKGCYIIYSNLCWARNSPLSVSSKALFIDPWKACYAHGLPFEAITFLKAEAGAISAPLNVFKRNMGHEEAFILNPEDI